MTPEASHIQAPNGRSYVKNKVDNGFFFFLLLPSTFIQDRARAFQWHRDMSAATPHLNSQFVKHCDLAQKHLRLYNNVCIHRAVCHCKCKTKHNILCRNVIPVLRANTT